MNAQNKVIGILFAETRKIVPIIVNGAARNDYVITGRGIACHIVPAMNAVGITIESGPVAVLGEALDLEEMELEVVEQSDDLPLALQKAEKELLAIPRGETLRNLFGAHGEELTRLIHHYRPVKTVWHRNQGPAFGVSMINVIRDPRESLHTEVKGIPIEQAAHAVFEALVNNGSAPLRETLEQYRDLLMGVLTKCRRYGEMMRYLKEYS